ncbi:unnamed protein product, partial [Ectocarpus sp. 13 AM-2016]
RSSRGTPWRATTWARSSWNFLLTSSLPAATPSSMTSSPSAASQPSSWNTFGPSALTGKASSATRRTAQSLFGSLTCSSTTASITWTRRSSSSLPSRPHRLVHVCV